jgi:hypothetical protein
MQAVGGLNLVVVKVAILRVRPRPWGATAFGVDEDGREIQFKLRQQGEPLGMSNRRTAMIGRQLQNADRPPVIEIQGLQVIRVEGQAPESR